MHLALRYVQLGHLPLKIGNRGYDFEGSGVGVGKKTAYVEKSDTPQSELETGYLVPHKYQWYQDV